MKKVLIFFTILLLLTTAQAQYPAAIKLAGDSLGMKTISNWMLAAGEINAGQAPYSIQFLNSKSHLTDKIAPYSLSDWYGYGLSAPCGTPIVITHTKGINGAPVTKTVSYGTVVSSLGGTGSKCWITQNLGADHQALKASDGTEASAGWYWQFNLKQGYKNDGTTLTPTTAASAWASNNTGSTDWDPSKDPCILLLGSGWRLPTYTEWNNTNATGGWTSYTNTYASPLKLHAAGFLDNISGTLGLMSSTGNYWSSTQSDDANGSYFTFGNSGSLMGSNHKADGFSVRCLYDFVPVAFTTCGSAFVVNHTPVKGVSPVTKTVSYGTVTSSLSGTSKCWITQNLGAENQASSANDSANLARGWFWQFGIRKGYAVGPNPAWNTIQINVNSDWLPTEDPCTIELGTGWRMPTFAEWTKVNTGWKGYADTYNSVLKIHAGGFLYNTDGHLAGSTTDGDYWSSTQGSNTAGCDLDFQIGSSQVINTDNKNWGVSLRCLKDVPGAFTTCGNSFVIYHTAGDSIVPVTKTVTYGTIISNLSGASKCWITQNLGADRIAASATDLTEASSGWYWQFNKKQGYKMADDGTTRTPSTTWDSTLSSTSDWVSTNDPCTLLLGSDWRIPTKTEWANVDAAGPWENSSDAYHSLLNLHAAGYIVFNTSLSGARGSFGAYWSSTLGTSNIQGYLLGFSSTASIHTYVDFMSYGLSVRCLR